MVVITLPYARHHNPLLIRKHSLILTVHKAIILWKNTLENKEMVSKNWVKNLQAAAYNGARADSKIQMNKYIFSIWTHIFGMHSRI